MRIAVEHVTRYTYAEEVTYGIQSLRLTPAGFAGQTIIDWRIESRPQSVMTTSRDGFGNVVSLMTLAVPHREVEIKASGTVEVEDCHGVVRGLAESAPLRVYLRTTPLTAPEGGICGLAGATSAKETVPFLHDLMNRIRDEVDYLSGVTSVATSAAEALASGKGVCQDHAHIFIAAARKAAIPARYVTGYILLDGSDAADAHHAWAEAWVDDLGWVGFDVANRICPNERYVRTAVGLDAKDAAPIRGLRRGGDREVLEVEVKVAQTMAQQ